LAICLVIVDSLPHEEIWREWIGEEDTDTDADELKDDSSMSICTATATESTSTSASANANKTTELDATKVGPSIRSCESIASDITTSNAPSSSNNNSNGNLKLKYKARLFIHAKHPERITPPWICDRLLPPEKCFKPEWNSPEVGKRLRG
jgi:hypothetical protein